MAMTIHLGLKGSPKSGNWGHAGRPGKVGGSIPRSGGLSISAVEPDQVKGYIADVKQWDDIMRRGIAMAALDVNPSQRAIAVKDNGELVAVAKIATEATGEYVYLHDLATKRLGYGRKMMINLAKIAVDNGLGMYWDSAVGAVEFYQKLGFAKNKHSYMFYAPLDTLKEFIHGNT